MLVDPRLLNRALAKLAKPKRRAFAYATYGTVRSVHVRMQHSIAAE
jgi:hypothetical protein